MNVNLDSLVLRFLGGKSEKNLLPYTDLKTKKTGWQGRDLFVKSQDSLDIYETYSAPNQKKSKYIPQWVMEMINNYDHIIKQEGDVFECGGYKFLKSQIPPVRGRNLKEIKAQNNVMDFGKNQYFKYVSLDGKEHYLYTGDKVMGTAETEYLRGTPPDKTQERYAEFWRRMMADVPVMYKDYSKAQAESYLKEAGIEHGFFTVKMGDREATQYYSGGKYAPAVCSKERYDTNYEVLTSRGGGSLLAYEPGCVWKFGGHEYVMNESHTFDIPYGEDIFDVEAPENYRCGQKIY